MPINPDLLIAAPMLQDALVDKDGTPMAGGTITCYHDNSRTTLKNWYYQSGTPVQYTYVPLPNPLTLSAAGTICDINGVDTIPFFYPFSENNQTVSDPYYITIVNHEQTNQITRANFPFLSSIGSSSTLVNTFNNLIINNGFWRNVAPNTVNQTPFTSVNLSSVTNLVVAPSQHDGFRMPDTLFIKNNTTATDAVTFTPFPLSNSQPINNTVVPEYYVNHLCSSPGTGETQKCYQFPISLHINTLASVPFTVSIQGQNVGGTSGGQNTITLFILQDTGTGTVSPVPVEIGQITLNSSWQPYPITGIFPATAGLTLGNGADDALYLQVQMPLNLTCSINFTKPSIYLTQGIVPNYSFQTYDQVDTVINSPRTGDVRVSVNSFYPYGWVPMNDGTIGNSSSNATCRKNADTWPLFNLLWSIGKTFDTGATFNAICQMFTSAGSPTDYGSTAISDFNLNKQLALTKIMGKVIMGTVPLAAIVGGSYTQGIVASSGSGGSLLITGTNGNFFFNGQPIRFIGSNLPGGVAANAIYYVANLDSSGGGQFNVAITYDEAIAGIPVVLFTTAGSGTDVSVNQTGSSLGEYAHTQTLSELVSHQHNPLSPNTNFIGDQSPGTASLAAGTGVAGTATTALTGGGSPFNITQPGSFYNIYIKL